MKRSSQVVLGSVAVLVAGLLTGCGESEPEEPDYAQICVNEEDVRVEDEECEDDSSGGRWFYGARGHGAPGVGSKVDTTKGSFVRPGSGKISTVSRGGFGGRSSAGGAGS